MGSSRTKLVDCLQVLGEHVWVLVIFGGDVLLDGFGKRDRMRPSKREEHNISTRLQFVLFIICEIHRILTKS